MVKKLLLLLVLPLVLFGGNLVFQKGLIKAHTEVFGDSGIEPSVSRINTDLMMHDNDLSSIHGKISFNILDLKSSNSGRDEHMQEMFDIKKYTYISLKINSLNKEKDQYLINGILRIHGMNKAVKIPVRINQNISTVTMQSHFIVKVSDYGMEPPSLLFFTVKDAVDINASIVLKKSL